MRELSVALVVIFVLWLIDKNNCWRPAFKIVLGFLIVSGIGVGGWYGWGSWSDFRAQTRHAAAVKDCQKRFVDADKFAQLAAKYGGVLETPCEQDPTAMPEIDLSAGVVSNQTGPKPTFDPDAPYQSAATPKYVPPAILEKQIGSMSSDQVSLALRMKLLVEDCDKQVAGTTAQEFCVFQGLKKIAPNGWKP